MKKKKTFEDWASKTTMFELQSMHYQKIGNLLFLENDELLRRANHTASIATLNQQIETITKLYEIHMLLS